ncbi:hypothetical protein CHR53_27240 [Neobacillus mesonae]|uniref:Uncharacterized protein n=1 Tax=Neobacillus mesonae TaxID=1193713 RepID=A0A3T0I5Q2_9BACI|nr:hypothetical protein CHR53_27240 [Neobacillus mesonae]
MSGTTKRHDSAPDGQLVIHFGKVADIFAEVADISCEVADKLVKPADIIVNQQKSPRMCSGDSLLVFY